MSKRKNALKDISNKEDERSRDPAIITDLTHTKYGKKRTVIDLTNTSSNKKLKSSYSNNDSWALEYPEQGETLWAHHVIQKGDSDKIHAAQEESSSLKISTSAGTTLATEDETDNTTIVDQGIMLRVRPKVLPVKSSCRVSRSLPLPFKGADPKFCLDRIDDMYQVYYDLEAGSAAQYGYMDRQKDINAKMRSILVDWLIEVHHKFKLESSTLWLCLNVLDRYLQLELVQRTNLQLVGVTALLVACKFEEIYPPEVRECVYITDYAYEKADVLAMESTILAKLNYNICVPTGYHFLARFLECIAASDRTRHIAHFYAERNMQEYDSLKFIPHVFAASAIYMTLLQQIQHSPGSTGDAPPNRSCWTSVLQEESGLAEADLQACTKIMIKHLKEEPETASKRRLNAVRKKYSTEKYNFVASLPLPSIG